MPRRFILPGPFPSEKKPYNELTRCYSSRALSLDRIERMRQNNLYFFIFLFLLAGCIPFPARTVMPLKTQVMDAYSGKPIPDATVLRIVCDVHDHSCENAIINRGKTDQNGYIKMSGNREWGTWVPAPGGFPVPNHQIVIWKDGYTTFVFSQYGSLNSIKTATKNSVLIEAIEEIPKDMKYFGEGNPNKLFLNGSIKLKALKKIP